MLTSGVQLMEIYGHRGAAGYVLENTVASVKKALELKVDGIEFDVRATKDRRPVIIHDETLKRTHKIDKATDKLTMAEIRSLTKTAEFPVPTLDQIMLAIGKKVPANVELKEIEAVQPSLKVLNDMAEKKLIDPKRVLITSFDHEAVKLFREHSERYKLGLLIGKLPGESYWKLAKTLDVYSVNISKKAVNEAFVERAHKDGRKVMVYTVNEKRVADRLKTMGVDAIFSDVPDKVR